MMPVLVGIIHLVTLHIKYCITSIYDVDMWFANQIKPHSGLTQNTREAYVEDGIG